MVDERTRPKLICDTPGTTRRKWCLQSPLAIILRYHRRLDGRVVADPPSGPRLFLGWYVTPPPVAARQLHTHPSLRPQPPPSPCRSFILETARPCTHLHMNSSPPTR